MYGKLVANGTRLFDRHRSRWRREPARLWADQLS
jgi:hypothetical protein